MPWKKLIGFSSLAVTGLLLTLLSAVIPAGWNSIYTFTKSTTTSAPASLRPAYLRDSWPLPFSVEEYQPLKFMAADGHPALCDGFGTTVREVTFFIITDNILPPNSGRIQIRSTLYVFSHGWPFRAFAYHDLGIDGTLPPSLTTPLNEDASEKAGWRLGIEFPSWIPLDRTIPRKIPVIPIVPGLIFDFLFWTGTVWAVFVAPFVMPGKLRHHRRLKRGQCLKCGYDLAGLPRCPECGQDTKPDAPSA